MDVVNRPAGDAVERRDLLGQRKLSQLVVAELQLMLDEPVDCERPRLRIEYRHRPRDRVDAPPVDRKDVAQKWGPRRGEWREDPARRRSQANELRPPASTPRNTRRP